MKRWMAVPVIALALAACDRYDGDVTGPGGRGEFRPRDLQASTAWQLDGWDGLDPVGTPVVELSWVAPNVPGIEAFRVYARRSGSGNYLRIATVTSCSAGVCLYRDRNVTAGRSYDYFVSTVRTDGSEFDSEDALRVEVPQAAAPSVVSPTATALDGGIYLQWAATGATAYRVYLERRDGSEVFFLVGETDGTGFVDERAENGREYGYRVVAVGAGGQFGRRSALASAVPRPDYHSELIYAHASDPGRSGFRFRVAENENPILSGSGASAQWRLESVNGVLSLVPLGSTSVTQGVFTTALTCGPGSESDCVAVHTAPAASQFSSSPARVDPGFTYVFRVVGDDGRIHYGKVRVQGEGVDASGRRVVVFDWAYQLRPEEPRLSVPHG